MARIKKDEELNNETTTATEATAAEEKKETVEAPATEKEETTEATAAEEEVKAVEATDAVLATLKLFPNLEEAYVTAAGNIYTKDTPKHVVGKAVLYKNPYFNQ